VNYDYGGEGIAYHDNDAGNQGEGPRQDEGIDTEYKGGIQNVGWVSSGEWIEYSIRVMEEGPYNIDFRVASNNSASRGPLSISLNDIPTGEDVIIPFTGDWGKFIRVSANSIYLTPEDTILRLEMGSGGFNIQEISFSSSVSSDNMFTDEDKEVLIYPNPAKSQLFIHSKGAAAELVDYKIFNIEGRLITGASLETNQGIDISTLIPGMYFIKLGTISGNRIALKFIKN
jgi:hypothetical protein